ncbi:bifunctional shikimate kinase/shikimate dehydrogenase [Methanofollis aquaemaris]|uniref:Shikimate dehydrogenase (NADP(+)) n=1 Tax=Methanofollis aquaemaris TaxID=126734 RepID=A0A8A3S6S7_9EURY|nr:shikimate kinase [Methanofollis aquaemaris]QSZ67569.1 bifunctional shikimate kinase/shikimate dehydrogenase [Methanofollis aquaemaris]
MKVVLIGYRGTGKSTVGRILADRLGLPFYDTDAMVEARAGRSIPAIFAGEGEEGFRALECAVVADLAGVDGIVATGGGAVLDPANVAALRRGGRVVLLEADAETIAERTTGSDRPPLTPLPLTDEVAALLARRRPYYCAAADFAFSTAGLTPAETADAVLALLAGRERDLRVMEGFCLPSGEADRLLALEAATGLYGIAGHPCLHSRSPELYTALFAAYGIDAAYTFFDHPEFGEVLRAARALGVQGLSVTVPHKAAALAAADEVDSHAQAIGAANTLVFCGDQVRATNTDWTGVRRPLEGTGARTAVVLGAGGAAAAAVYALLDLGCEVTVLARNLRQAEGLAGRFGCGAGEIRDFTRITPPDVVVHATPVGMGTDPRALLSAADLDPATTIFDLVYTPQETPLLRAAAARGCRTIPGTEMFVYQACEQFLHMTGIQVGPEAVREVLGL